MSFGFFERLKSRSAASVATFHHETVNQPGGGGGTTVADGSVKCVGKISTTNCGETCPPGSSEIGKVYCWATANYKRTCCHPFPEVNPKQGSGSVMSVGKIGKMAEGDGVTFGGTAEIAVGGGKKQWEEKVPGPELIVNGSFETNLEGWRMDSKQNGVATFSSSGGRTSPG